MCKFRFVCALIGIGVFQNPKQFLEALGAGYFFEHSDLEPSPALQSSIVCVRQPCTPAANSQKIIS